MEIKIDKNVTDILLKMSKEEISFLANISENISVTSRLLDTAPLPYMMYGNANGYNGQAVFKYVDPIIDFKSKQQSGLSNGTLEEFSPKPSNKIPLMFLDKNGKITESTTKWAIDQVSNKKMTVTECIAIIRQKNGLVETKNRYSLQLPISDKNTDIMPLEWGTSDNGVYSFSLGNETVQQNIKALNRAYLAADELEKYGADIEYGLKSGKYNMDESDQEPVTRIIYEWVPNPFYDEQLKDADLDGIPNESDRDSNSVIIPTHIKKPILPNVGEFFSEELYTPEEISYTTIYFDHILSGVDAAGKKIEGKGYGILNEDTQKLLSSNHPEHKEKSGIGGALYGSKYYVYGGFFTTFIGLSVLSGLRTRYGLVARFFEKSNWTQKAVTNFLGGPLESGLTTFKGLKDITTNDFGRLFRDIFIYRLGHDIAHDLGEKAILRYVLRGPLRGVLIEIPWVGWALAASTIAYDFLAPIVKANMDETQRRNVFISACRINPSDQTIGDPGYAYYSNGTIKRKYYVLKESENKGIKIGAEKNPVNGNYIFDKKTGKIIPIYIMAPTPPPPKQKGGIPGVTVPRIVPPNELGFNTINEKQIQGQIESTYFQLNIANYLITDNLSNRQYTPEPSNLLPPIPVFPEGIIEERADLESPTELASLDYYTSDSNFSDDIQSYGDTELDNPLIPRINFIRPNIIIRQPRVNDSPEGPPVGNTVPDNMTQTMIFTTTS
jgi:hypothetical protein